MKISPLFLTLCILSASIATNSLEPRSLKASSAASNVNATFFYLSFDANAAITQFTSTQIVPSSSNDPRIPGNVQAIWPALQNDNGIIQTPVANQGGVGEWWFIGLEFCCKPTDYQANKAEQVYPGDLITTTYTLINEPTITYAISWNVTRGAIGNNLEKPGFSGTSNFDPFEHETNPTPFTSILFSIELQKGGLWDFGPTTWTSISITAANSSSPAWCAAPSANTEFEYTISSPVVVGFSEMDGVTCAYDNLVLGSEREVEVVGEGTGNSEYVGTDDGVASSTSPTSSASLSTSTSSSMDTDIKTATRALIAPYASITPSTKQTVMPTGYPSTTGYPSITATISTATSAVTSAATSTSGEKSAGKKLDDNGFGLLLLWFGMGILRFCLGLR